MTGQARAIVARDAGAALLLALVATLLIAALTGALLVLANTEVLVAANHRVATETLSAAGAALERARADLAAIPQWSDALGGLARSSWYDGRLQPRTAWNTPVDLLAALAALNAEATSGPWGANNPNWRLFASGDLEAMIGDGAVQSTAYAAVWIADDEGETDNNPAVDSNGVVVLRGTAFGTSGAVCTIHATVKQEGGGARWLTWKVLF